VVSVATLLDRIDALESSTDRAATRDADRAAVATLTKRGVDAAVRSHLREVIAAAQKAKVPVPVQTGTAAADRQNALCELRAWHKDWAETAHAVIRRRDHLILMGLGRRHGRQDGADEGAAIAATTAAASSD
jgi:hypothetical protein